MTIQVGRGLQEADSRNVARRRSLPEMGQIILMIGLVAVADHRDGARRQMVWICRRRIFLEWLMVRHEIRRGNGRQPAVARATNRLAVCLSRSRRESPAEVSPTKSFGVQQVTDIPAGHDYL